MCGCRWESRITKTIFLTHLISVDNNVLRHSKQSGKRENSSMITCMNIFRDLDGNGSSKSIFKRSNDSLVLINVPASCAWNCGLISAHVLQDEQTRFTSSVEKGRFLEGLVYTSCTAISLKHHAFVLKTYWKSAYSFHIVANSVSLTFMRTGYACCFVNNVVHTFMRIVGYLFFDTFG